MGRRPVRGPTRALGQIAAEVLDLPAQIDALSGTGYVEMAGHENYLQRARRLTGAPRLIVVQGGSNDHAHDLRDVERAARRTFGVLRSRFPNAALLALGPGPDPAPVTDRQRAVDAAVTAAATACGVHCASILAEEWITADLRDLVIDARTEHPTVEGHAYLGTRLAALARRCFPHLTAGWPSDGAVQAPGRRGSAAWKDR